MEGQIEVQLKIDGVEINRYFGKGFTFGFFEHLTQQSWNFTYRSASNVHVMALKCDDFEQLLQNYGDIKQKITLNTFKLQKIFRSQMIMEINEKLYNKLDLPKA